MKEIALAEIGENNCPVDIEANQKLIDSIKKVSNLVDKSHEVKTNGFVSSRDVK